MKKVLTVVMPTLPAQTPLETTDVRVWMVSEVMVFNVNCKVLVHGCVEKTLRYEV